MLLIWMKRMKKKKRRMKKIRNIEWEISFLDPKIFEDLFDYFYFYSFWMFHSFEFAPQIKYVLFRFTTPSSYNSFSFAFIHCLMKKSFEILKTWRYLLKAIIQRISYIFRDHCFWWIPSEWWYFWGWKICVSISNLKDLMISSHLLTTSH